MPFVNEEIILGGFHTPGVGVVDSLRAGTLMREAAQALGALTVSPSTEVTGIDVESGRVRRVQTDKGPIEAEYVFVCCGVWSPRIARMAGAAIPLTPAVHQMITVGPIPLLEQTQAEIAFPIVRDMDALMYERQYGGDMEVGSYAHRPILWPPTTSPHSRSPQLSPTELPFTSEDFDVQMEHALELIPEILTAEGAGIRYAINGLLSLTPDGLPVLGETPEVKNLWSVAAVWIKEGPGVGRAVAEWAVEGASEIDVHGSDIARFHPHQRDERHVVARTSEGFNKTYGIVHPAEQWESNRNVRVSPFHASRAGARRRLLRDGRLGAALVVRVERGAARGVRRPRDAARGRVGVALVVADRERRAPGDARPGRDDRPVRVPHPRRQRPGRAEALQQIALAELDVEPGRVVYTPVLDHNGGFKADLTIMRLGPELFRIVTGAAHGMADRKWFSDRLPQDGSAQLTDVTEDWCTVGVWGPRARDLVGSVTSDDVSHAGFPFARCREVELGGVRALASRISYVGELGWELYAPVADGAALWDVLWEAGQPLGVVPAGIGVYGTTGRIEKGYRLYGAELDPEYNVAEAGLTRPTVKEHDFVGKDAYLRHREEEPAASCAP